MYKSGIYCISSPINKKVYIGHSVSITARWTSHRHRLRVGTHVNIHLQAAWDLYGEKAFIFSIVESLPSNLTKQEYEAIETKWVLHFNSHLREFGYNKCLPGSIPLRREEENCTVLHRNDIPKVIYICINKNTNEVFECIGPQEVKDISGVALNHVAQFASYWNKVDDGLSHKGRKKSYREWLIVKKEDYNPEFDYTGHKRTRNKDGVKKTWRDYYHKERFRVKPENIIPHEDRNLKRVSIVAVNIETGEEKQYRMIKDCYVEFNRTKVNKCLNAPYGKYKHRGYYFRRA